MLLINCECINLLNNNNELKKILLPSIITAVVSIISIIIQAVTNSKSTKQLYKNILYEKKYDSIKKFYQPLLIYLFSLEKFFEQNKSFKINNVSENQTEYSKKFKELKDICISFLPYFEQKDGFFPLNSYINKELLELSFFVFEVSKSSKSNFVPKNEFDYKKVHNIIESINKEINDILKK